MIIPKVTTAIIGVKSNIPTLGTILRIGLNIGSVISWIILTSGLLDWPLGMTQDMTTLAKIAKLSK